MLDSIKEDKSCQSQYVQKSPRFLCRNARRFQQISESKGFVCKCRDPRCSIQCHENWSQKQSACLARHLRDLPADLVCYRGNLTLSPGATPEDHHKVRASFLLSLRRWAKRDNLVAEIHATTHPTSPDNAHYDFVAYSGSPQFPSILRQKWVSAGGLRATCVRLHQDEKDATAKYTSKVPFGGRPIHKEGETDTLPQPKLLNVRQISGLDITWHTRSSKASSGFWRGSSVDQIWSLLIAEWHPEPDEEIILLRGTLGLNPIREREPEPVPPQYHPGLDLRRDAWVMSEYMPRTARDAVGATAYGERWGVSGDWMLRVFQEMRGSIRLNGEIVDGKHKTNAWYIPI
jgi:hypothetical protein